MSSIRLVLTPVLVCDEADHGINVRMTLDIPHFEKDQVLFHHTMFRGPIKTMQYTSDDLRLQDALDSVPIHHQDSKDGRQRKFLAGRDLPSRGLTVEYKAIP